MKMIFKPTLLSLFIIMFFTACNNEELFVEPTADVVVDPDSPAEDPVADTTYSTTPCDFTLDTVQSGDTVIMNCLMDLGGASITLPSNVTIVYEGGDIINGTLTFSDNTVISGELLNSTLTLSGSTPQLKDPVFNFIPSRWGIVEGEVSKEIAYNNQLVIQNIIDQTKKMGVTTFQIDKLDAYFESNSGADFRNHIIELPSDFHFKMSNNTYLRVFPVLDSQFSAYILKIYKATNIIVSGGNLIGDRIQRGSVGGGNVVFEIKGGQDIVVDNVKISYASAAGLTINSYLFPNDPNYFTSKNILVTNCLFDSNRANNLSITDGEDIIVQNCTSYRAGNDIGESKGIAPRIGIVVEPVEGQRTQRIIIRNNKIRESVGNSILVSWGNDFTITGNEADHMIGWTGASNVKVINNPNLQGIIAGFDGEYALSQSVGNIISGNTIRNAPMGIEATNDDIKIFDNTITNCTIGMMLRNLKDSEIYNNVINGSVENGFGFVSQLALDNVIIRNNNVNIPGRSMSIQGINYDDSESNYKMVFKDNVFECGNNGVVTYSNGMEITGNNFSISGIFLTSSKNILFNNNIVNVSVSNGSALGINSTTTASNIIVKNNTIENTNTGYGAYGMRLNSVGSNYSSEDTFIKIQENTINTAGYNYGIRSEDFNGMTISGNTFGGTSQEKSIFFRGNNSIIENNKTNGIDVEGLNNTVFNN